MRRLSPRACRRTFATPLGQASAIDAMMMVRNDYQRVSSAAGRRAPALGDWQVALMARLLERGCSVLPEYRRAVGLLG